MPIVAARTAELTVDARPYQPYGAAIDALYCKEPEVLLSGPAGTGKSRAWLEKIFLVAEKYPRCRILIVRKTRASCTESVLVTWEEKVVPAGHPCLSGPQRGFRQAYHFPNGSEVVIGGMDKPTKIMSTEYDIIYVPEAIELAEADWESLMSRLRNYVLPYQQIIGDTNPDGPRHWLYLRAQSGKVKMLESRHEDNPVFWDIHHNRPTPQGADYIGKLDRLTGVRYKRLRKGIWAAAEGLVFEHWDPAIHRIYRKDLPRGWQSWRRIWVVDFGFTNPFVWQEWAIGPDGDMYRLKEIYRSRRLVEDHAADILQATGYRFDERNGRLTRLPEREKDADPLPEAIICDHDREDRATLERHLHLPTRGAFKAITAGNQAVAARLGRPEGATDRATGELLEPVKPRIFWVYDAQIHPRDEEMIDQKLPASTEEEFDSYVMDTSGKNQEKGELPVDKDNHGMDTNRYAVAYVDNIRVGTPNRAAYDVF